MKKVIFWSMMMLAVLTLPMMVACGSDGDDPDDGIDTTPISLYAGDEKTISNAKEITSSNEFVVYTDGSVIKGYHVGEAKVVVNGKKTIPVSVLGKYHLYDDPVCEWGCDMNYVKNNQKQGTLKDSDEKSITYQNAGAASFLMYTFDNGKLTSVGAVVSTNHTSDYASYLGERFFMMPTYQGEDTYFVGIDALELSKAKTVAVLKVYSSKYLITVYMPASKFSSESSSRAMSRSMTQNFEERLKNLE